MIIVCYLHLIPHTNEINQYLIKSLVCLVATFYSKTSCFLQSDRYYGVQKGFGPLCCPMRDPFHQTEKHRSSPLQTGRHTHQVRVHLSAPTSQVCALSARYRILIFAFISHLIKQDNNPYSLLPL